MGSAHDSLVGLTIGNFDGVHLGHRRLISKCREMVGEDGKVIVLTFYPHPMKTLNPERAPAEIESFDERKSRLIDAGADEVVAMEPTAELLSMSAQGFVDHVIDDYRPNVIVEGHDFRFGKRRSGTPTVLKELSGLRGVDVNIVSPVEVSLTDQSIVRASSSMGRWLIDHGRVRDVGFVLGRAHELVGSVVRGDQLGRTIGFRTANLNTDSMLPCDGVYGCVVELPDGSKFGGAMNIGARPTVDGIERRAEVHIFDERGEPWVPEDGFAEYGWDIRVGLVGWVRDQIKFSSIDALSDQLGRDVDRAREMVGRLIAWDDSGSGKENDRVVRA